MTTASRIEAWRADIAERVADNADQRGLAAVVLDVIYPVLGPVADMTYEQLMRWNHRDIAEMTDAQLRREYKRAADRLAYEDTPSDWLVKRVPKLRAEGERRRQGATAVEARH